MCIAILNKKGSTLKKKLLANCWENNYDGAGFMYTDGSNIVVHKELKDFDSYYAAYAAARKNFPSSHIVLHFRISTHGAVNEANAHPFLVNKRLGFVHNGIISGMANSTKYSDTYMFNKDILKPLPVGFELNKDILDVVEDAIGSYNKLIFLNSDNEYAIVNEAAGHWENGCWFSNRSYTYSSGYVDRGGVKTKITTGSYQPYSKGTVQTWDNRLGRWDDYDDLHRATLNKPYGLTPEYIKQEGLIPYKDLPRNHHMFFFQKEEQGRQGVFYTTRKYSYAGYGQDNLSYYKDEEAAHNKKKQLASLVPLLD